MAEFTQRKPHAAQLPKQCFFCTANMKVIDYKDPDLLKKFTNPQGKIGKRSRTSTCAGHQRLLSRAIKRARFLALLPFTTR
ncbi:MAG: 30S ribosomal protein S18 [Candidatus Sungbacteria bacterium RIFCSPHIGHO2_02_FULL_49_20]|uniref:Small ribosomal subunit protein bS18 n=1 Tax=Candidatus Sungbacteria bacterium RIFCSPHIGHO2_02_FULL_49_20 TaxID=1802272 RepID=A0A1G2KUJ9_9BACT|nr:MAG: 30S ribosomal protein S18 [Candidatus Sungbacteria bacterium RIFCSPHIGHO2_02_FULL_49_20]